MYYVSAPGIIVRRRSFSVAVLALLNPPYDARLFLLLFCVSFSLVAPACAASVSVTWKGILSDFSRSRRVPGYALVIWCGMVRSLRPP